MTTVLHSALTTTDLHEPKGIAAQSANKYYVSDGAGSGTWTAIPVVPFPNKHIAGLTWSNAADASNDITIATGTCRDSTNTEDITLSVAITKRIDASWAVGDNQGGFDTGSVLATGVYHLFLIKRTDTGVVDAIFSATLGTPTLPTNYTKFRRIGSIYRNSGVNSAVTVTELEGGGIECTRNTPVVDTGTACASTGTTLTIPQFPNNSSGLEAIVSFSTQIGSAAQSGERFALSATSQSLNINAIDVSFNTTLTTPDGGSDAIAFQPGGFARIQATSGQIKGYSGSGVGNIRLTNWGWKDARR